MAVYTAQTPFYSRTLWTYSLLFICFSLIISPARANTETTPSYSFAAVPQFAQRRLLVTWKPILQALSEYTGFHFKMIGTAKISDFEDKFNRGDFDIAYMNPYHALNAYTSQGYLPIVRDGAHVLRGILVVHKDSGITSPSQLANKTLALPSPNALGASLLLRADLKQKFAIDMQIKYVNTHSSVYLHVAKRLVDAGGGVMRTLVTQHPDIQNHLQVIYQTRSVLPHPVTVHPRVPAAHREKIQQALLALAQTKKGRILLNNVLLYKVVKTSIDEYREIGSWGLDQLRE